MAWRGLGRFSVGPLDGEIELGPITVPAYNGVEVRVRQVSPTQGFRFAYGLLSFVSDAGVRELGSVKFWAGAEASDYRLGLGLLSEGSGVLKFEPRNYNLRWIKAGFPWELEFWVDESAVGGGTGGGGGGGGGTTPPARDLLTSAIEHVGTTAVDYGAASFLDPAIDAFANINFGYTFATPVAGVYTFRVWARDDKTFGSAGVSTRYVEYVGGGDTTVAGDVGEGWYDFPISGAPRSVTRFEFTPNDVSSPCRMMVRQIEVNGQRLVNTPGHPVLRFADATDLEYLRAGDGVVEEGGAGDGTGVVESVSVADRTVTLSASTGAWSLGARLKKPQ